MQAPSPTRHAIKSTGLPRASTSGWLASFILTNEVFLNHMYAGTITNKACNQVHWSPQGKHIVLAGLKGLNGQLEFYSVDDMETMAAAEHFMATDVDWDPTGVFPMTLWRGTGCLTGVDFRRDMYEWHEVSYRCASTDVLHHCKTRRNV